MKETNIEYPINIDLIKLRTLENAEYPQKEKYPNGTIRSGLMWEFSLPKVDEAFNVHQSKLHVSFMTSPITEIIETTNEYIIFKTLNSMYKIQIQIN